MTMRISAYIIIASMLLSACNKDEEINPPISEVPEIELMSVSPGTVVALEDSIVFLIHYIDGDGDLGYNEPDSMSLYITDNRIPLTESFFVPWLAPEGSKITIEGDLEVQLHNTILVDPDSDSETVTFTVWMRDRAGNLSNSVTTGPITVTRD